MRRRRASPRSRARRSAQQGMQATGHTDLTGCAATSNYNAAQAGSTAASSSANFQGAVGGDRRQRKARAARWRRG